MTTPKRPWRRRSKLLIAIGAFILVAFVWLAISMRSVPGDAGAAKDELTATAKALQSSNVTDARTHVAVAQRHIDQAHQDVESSVAKVWSWVPVFGTPVSDARHLVHALSEATAIARIGVDLYPSVSGDEATLFRDGQVDRPTLDRMIVSAKDIQGRLASADMALSEVKANTPFVGPRIAQQRDAAAAKVSPMLSAVNNARPLLDQLPAILGFEGKKSYLIAMLNPAELRYSGGAALSFSPMAWKEGKLRLGDSLTPLDDPRISAHQQWRGVPGNRLFHPVTGRVTTSTFAPSWSVSGEEMLRAWRGARGVKHDGVVAIDVVALSKMLGATGPIKVPGYGELNEGNLTKALVGSYDDYYPDPNAQDSRNDGVIPVFQSRLFDGGNFTAKAKALAEAAAGRHFALYFRDDEAQKAVDRIGFAGDLAHADGDYLGVFTQNVNQSKTDYYQRRTVVLDVALHADGSASNSIDASVHNDTPPFKLPFPDPRIGYFTRWSGLAMGIFLPEGVSVEHASVLGKPFAAEIGSFFDHSVVNRQMNLSPGATGSVKLNYEVRRAAHVSRSKDLVYKLAYDPQGTVNPQAVTIRVHLPAGYRASALPKGWSAAGEELTYSSTALASTLKWEIPIVASS